jgi:hypothetical protein
MGTWTNSDGLRVLFGTDEAVTGKAGEYCTDGAERVVEVSIAVTPLTTSAVRQDEFVTLPAGAFITKVELVTLVAVTSSGSGVLNVGLQRLDRTTELDYDGLIAALPVASFNAAGETVSLTEGVTYHGALIGTELAYPGYLTADYDTADFTAGTVRVRISYMANVV